MPTPSGGEWNQRLSEAGDQVGRGAHRLREFWDRVTEGLEVQELWSQIRADARASYRLYSRDFEARAPQGTRRHNYFHTAQEFIWAILEKLTPARRILLLLGVLLVIFPAGGFSYQGKSGVEVVEFDFHFYGGVVHEVDTDINDPAFAVANSWAAFFSSLPS